METGDTYRTETRKNLTEGEREELRAFLSASGLELEDDLDETVIVRKDGSIAATASSSGAVLKCIAVDPEIRGENLAGTAAGTLVNSLYHRGLTDLFLFTKPQNKRLFENLAFRVVYELKDEAILMENNPFGLSAFTSRVLGEAPSGIREKVKRKDEAKISAIVVNCNPFTKGHLYLIEKAASESEHLYVFVVSEDRSLFPSEARYTLVKKGTEHIKNVSVHHGGPYIISASTFPSYFIKEKKKITQIHARMDAGIFAQKIAPALGIKRRFVGEEPLCPVTDNYNKTMAEILPRYGIEFTVIKRIEAEGDVISASRVRRLIKEDRLDEAKTLLPEVTYEYLTSEDAKDVMEKIKGKVK